MDGKKVSWADEGKIKRRSPEGDEPFPVIMPKIPFIDRKI
jgi:hypothetical protein